MARIVVGIVIGAGALAISPYVFYAVFLGALIGTLVEGKPYAE